MTRIAAALALSLLANVALAAETEVVSVATISQQEGTVLVNQGEEFVTAADAQALNAGDRVMVMEGGSAVITFADGCALPLVAGSMVAVPAVSTCAGAVASVERIGPSYAQAVGATHVEPASTWWVFGTISLGIAYAIAEDDYSITPRPVSP